MTEEQLEQLDEDAQDPPFTREELRRHRKPVGARRAMGKKYLDYPAITKLGAAIEKRARKARRRAKEAQAQGDRA